MPECVNCKKNFTEQTLKSYDGKHCGRCYSRLKTTTPEQSEERWYSSILRTFREFNVRDERPATPISQDYVKIPDGGKVRSTIPKAVRDRVWKIWIGNEMKGKCYVCDKDIWFTDFHCAHITADALGGEVTVENLRPSCPTCNMSMGTHNLVDFVIGYGMKPDNYRIRPVQLKELLLRIPPTWDRRIVLKIINDRVKNVELGEWITYITWMIFDLPENMPEHIAMLLVLKKISIVGKKPEDALPAVISVISEIWDEWHARFKTSVMKDLTNYKVYFLAYDTAAWAS